MATHRLLVRLPAELARRFRQQVPTRGRSAFVQHLLEQALVPEGSDDDRLCLIALDVEQDERLAVEMANWETTVGDGLTAHANEAKGEH